MNNKLPAAFLEKMMDLLGSDEFERFLESYDLPRVYGLRINTQKIGIPEFLEKSPFALTPVPWASEGFYYEEGQRPGKHPYYHAGLYYIQEPSAMAPVELLNVQPGDKVLDLCAAPGGKSTQIAAKLKSEGVLVVNDNHSDRVKALVKNLELFGVRNAVVLNEKPERMIPVFRGYFDKILIDAPCSGEGMFRKEEDMMSQWQRHSVTECSIMQRDILGQAAQMLAPGGSIVYSTCTFSPEENEAQIAELLDRHTEFEVVRIERADFAPGRPDWVRAPWCSEDAYSEQALAAVAGTARLWPHRLKGEGHFVALLRKRADGDAAVACAPAVEAPAAAAVPAAGERKRSGRESLRRGGRTAEAPRAAVSLEPLQAFAGELLRSEPFAAARLVCYGEHAYASPAGLPELHGLKVVRPGWYIGALHRGRFEPSHALAMGLRFDEAKRVVSLALGDARALRYLKGETLEVAEVEVIRDPDLGQAAKGYCLVCIDSHPVGWGKWHDGMLKNEYPPGWRWT